MRLKIEDLKPEDIGREVRYIAWDGCPQDAIEYGQITSYNQRAVFVRYGKDLHAKATTPSDLEFTG